MQLLLNLAPKPTLAQAEWLPTVGTHQATQATLNANPTTIGTICLYGPSGCGKTHLLAKLASQNPSLVLADNLESLTAQQQEELFHHFNNRQGRGLITTSQLPVAQLSLLPDLKSRLLTGQHIEMQLPTEAELTHLLQSWATTRQLTLSPEVTHYLLTRTARNPHTLLGLLNQLNTLSLLQKRAITIPLVHMALARSTPES